MKTIKVGIVGGSGYAGEMLIKLLSKHPHVKIGAVCSTSIVGENIPGTELTYSSLSLDILNKMDIVFLSVPHGKASPLISRLKCKVIDMSSDSRLSAYYGIPELEKKKKKIIDDNLVANPGCYATACILSAYPIKNRIKKVVFDCISGYSGGGKKASEKYDYEGNIIAYDLVDHFHIKEISKALDAKISFTPHVVDAFSGIMCTAHIFLKKKVSASQVKKIYSKFYNGTFTHVYDKVPCSKDAVKTPYCLIGGFEIDSNCCLAVVSVIDNLMKGAASQAVENMNMMFGMKHDVGLEIVKN